MTPGGRQERNARPGISRRRTSYGLSPTHLAVTPRRDRDGDQGVRTGHDVSRGDGADRRRVVGGLAAPAARQARLAQRPVHRPRRHRLRAARLLRLADPDAEPRQARRRRAALQQHAHDRALLSQPVVHVDRPQSPFERDGVHHRGGDRLPGLERPDPVRERLPVRDVAGEGLQHDGARQVAPDADRAVQPGRPLRPLAARPRLRTLLRVHGRRHAPVLPRPRIRQPPGPAAAHAGTGLSPDRGSGRPRHPFRRGRQAGRAREAVLHVLLPGRDARAPPRAARVGGQVQGPVRRRLGRLPRQGVRAAAEDGRLAGGDAAVHARSGCARLGQPGHRREAPLRADDGGLRRFPRAHRPPHRAAHRLPRQDGAARRHADHGRQRQRRQRRGRPPRLGQREPVLQQRPRDAGGGPEGDRRPGWPASISTTIPGAGPGRATRRSVAGSARRTGAASPIRSSSTGRRGSRPAARSATSTPTSSTWCRRCWRRSGSTRRARSAASRSHRSRACRSRTRSATPMPTAATTPSTSRCSATGPSITTGGGRSARCPGRRSRRRASASAKWRSPRRSCARSTRTAGSCTTSTTTSRRRETSRTRTATS